MLPWIQALAAAIAATPELIKLGKGFSDRRKARKIMSETDRPVRKTNDYYRDYLSDTQLEAFGSGLPNESRYINQLNTSTAATMDQIAGSQQSPTAMMMGFLSAQNNGNVQLDRLIDKGTEYRNRQLANYYNALLQNGQQEDMNWNWNEMGPYEDAMKTASALFNSGQMNMFNGAQGLSNVGLGVLGNMGGAAGGGNTGGGTGGGGTAGGASGERMINTAAVDQQNSPADTYDLPALRDNIERIYGPVSDQQFTSYVKGLRA